jgi:hypothetical protein
MGYKYLHKPDHPNARSTGQIKRCRFIMSEILGRPLLKTELVHHIDGDKSNDNIENLVVISRVEHGRTHMTGSVNPLFTNYRTKVCPNCGNEFSRTSINNFVRNKCCSAKCRGEYYKKEKGCNAKINQEIADKIKGLKGLLASRKIAAAFGISPTQVKRILRGDAWA